MKTKGKSLPPKMGPVPSTNCVTAGILTSGWRIMSATQSAAMVPIFMKVDR